MYKVGFLKTEVTFIFSFGRLVAKIWLNVPVDRLDHRHYNESKTQNCGTRDLFHFARSDGRGGRVLDERRQAAQHGT